MEFCLNLGSTWHFGSWRCTPPPRIGNFSQIKIFAQVDLNWLMYPPPNDWKFFPKVDFCTGGFELADVPPLPGFKKFSKNEMLIFRLCSAFDHQPSILSDESCLKYEKMTAKSSKNEMLIFRLHSTFDHRLSILRDESGPKCKNIVAKSSKMKCSFLDYIQLLMMTLIIIR